MAARSPLLRLQSDEKLVAAVRRGNDHAFEMLVSRYSARLAAFCRHMLGSSEDAEDVLQEVFAAAYTAMNADERPLAVRPWLYKIARNRSLNHIRRAKPIGQDDMDVHLAEHGASTADKAQGRMDFALLLDDVSRLAETQRTALVLREMEHLSYDQIADAMDTTVPAVKSLLVRARIGLAEASEARALSCENVRLDLGAAAEGLGKLSPAVRRHLKGCDRCGSFQRHLRQTNRALAAVLPIGPLFLLKKLFLAHVGHAAAGGGSASSAGAGFAGAAAGSSSAGGLLSTVTGVVGTKAAAGLAAAALVSGGAVEVEHLAHRAAPAHPAAVAAAPAPSTVLAHRAVSRPGPAVAARSTALARTAATRAAQGVPHPKAPDAHEPKTPAPAPKPAVPVPVPVAATPAPSAPAPINVAVPAPTPAPATQPVAPATPTISDTTVLPAPPPAQAPDTPADPTPGPATPPPPPNPAVTLPPANATPPPPPPGDVRR